MTKDDISNLLAIRAGITKSQALHTVDCLVDILSEALSDDIDIFIRGFGTFKTLTSKARKARDINKGTVINVPPRHIVRFKPSLALKRKMND